MSSLCAETLKLSFYLFSNFHVRSRNLACVTPLCAFDTLQSCESCNPNLFNEHQKHSSHTRKAKHVLKQYRAAPDCRRHTHNTRVPPRPVTGGCDGMNPMGWIRSWIMVLSDGVWAKLETFPWRKPGSTHLLCFTCRPVWGRGSSGGQWQAASSCWAAAAALPDAELYSYSTQGRVCASTNMPCLKP